MFLRVRAIVQLGSLQAVCELTVWGPAVSLDELRNDGTTHSTLESYSWGLQIGGLQRHSKDFWGEHSLTRRRAVQGLAVSLDGFLGWPHPCSFYLGKKSTELSKL